MWENIKKDPLLRFIILIFSGIAVLGLALLALNMLFGGQGNMLNYHYSMMYGYNAAPNSIMTVLAKLLLFVSSVSFLASLAVYFIKGINHGGADQNNKGNVNTLNTNTCNDFESEIKDDKECCNAAEKQEENSKDVDVKSSNEPDIESEKSEESVVEHIQQETTEEKVISSITIEADVENESDKRNTTEAVEKDDLITRLYQNDATKKKNNKKSKK